MLVMIITLCSCSYFQVKDAIKEADRGNYVASLNNLLSILREDSENRRALDAFELIYPNAEKKYYDELDLSRGMDIVTYTKALLNLLRIQEVFYSLPEISKRSVAVVKPPVQERNSIKKELAQNFYDLGMRMKPVTYEEKLRTYGYFSQAQKYDLNGVSVVPKLKSMVVDNIVTSTPIQIDEIADEVFMDQPLAREEFKAELKKQGVPKEIAVEGNNL